MSLWQRIKDWFAQPDPMEVESTFFPDGSQPIPDSLFIPGESARLYVPDHGRPDPNDER